jgi:hypothetical protein
MTLASVAANSTKRRKKYGYSQYHQSHFLAMKAKDLLSAASIPYYYSIPLNKSMANGSQQCLLSILPSGL